MISIYHERVHSNKLLYTHLTFSNRLLGDDRFTSRKRASSFFSVTKKKPKDFFGERNIGEGLTRLS